MRTSKPGKSVYLDVGIWYDEGQGHIHITAKNVKGFHTTVSADPESKRGLALIAHEMLHVRQQRKAGWLRFLASYVWRLRKRGHRGKNNEHHPLERPAYALQREVRRALDRDS